MEAICQRVLRQRERGPGEGGGEGEVGEGEEGALGEREGVVASPFVFVEANYLAH